MAVKRNILKGDTVMIRRGKESGKRGTSRPCNPAAGRATVEGINIVKRHTKQGQQGRQHGRSGADRRHHREGSAAADLGAAVRLREVQDSDAAAPRPHRRRRARIASASKCGEPARESAKGA